MEEPYSEKDQLLEEIKDFAVEEKEIKILKVKQNKLKNKLSNQGKSLRNNVAVHFFNANSADPVEVQRHEEVMIERWFSAKLTSD